jgi:putative ABC transport system substrate-binding protein
MFAAAATPLHAQPAGRAARVGVVMGDDSNDAGRFLQAFKDGMKEHGYEENRNLELAVLDYGRDRAKAAAVADQLIGWTPAVIVANVSSVARIVQERTRTIPIVMVTALDPVGEGLVSSLVRPGGNLTGMASLGQAIDVKLVELVRELVPGARRFALLVNPAQALSRSREEAAAKAAKALALEMAILHVRGAGDISRLGQNLEQERAEALVIATEALLFSLRDELVRAALRARVPSVALLPEFALSGAVASYGHDIAASFHGAARYVARILKGAKPAELPIEQPTRFQLVLNARSARALGLTIPAALLVRADSVIE